MTLGPWVRYKARRKHLTLFPRQAREPLWRDTDALKIKQPLYDSCIHSFIDWFQIFCMKEWQEDSLTKASSITGGVKWGCVLAPILFGIYLNEMLKEVPPPEIESLNLTRNILHYWRIIKFFNLRLQYYAAGFIYEVKSQAWIFWCS